MCHFLCIEEHICIDWSNNWNFSSAETFCFFCKLMIFLVICGWLRSSLWTINSIIVSRSIFRRQLRLKITTKNLVVFGVPEEGEENVDSKVKLLLGKLEEKSRTTGVVGEPPLPPPNFHTSYWDAGRVLRDPEVWKLGGKWRSTYVHDNASTLIWHNIFQGERSIEKLQDRITNVSMQMIGWALLCNKSEHTIHKKLHYRVTNHPSTYLRSVGLQSQLKIRINSFGYSDCSNFPLQFLTEGSSTYVHVLLWS